MSKKTDEQVEATPEAKLAEISKEVSRVEGEAAAITVNSPESVAEATTFLSSVKIRLDRIEELRTFFTKPLLEQKRRIDDLFKGQYEPLEAVYRRVKRAVADYHLEQEKIARAEEYRLRKLQEKKNERRAAAGKELDLTPAPSVERIVPTTTQTDAGKSSARKVWKFEVVNEALLDRQFLKPDESAIRRAVAAGARDLVGVRIYEDFDVSVSAR